MEQICGIYKITNLINNKSYIGQSIDIYTRWHQHKYADCKPSTIHKAIRKYGLKNFSFEIIEQCKKEELNEREIFWITYYDTYNQGYNLTIGGKGQSYYNYEIILNLWNEGNNCKNIAQLIPCDVNTVSKALHYFGITEEEIRHRSNNFKNRPIVAVNIVDNRPLKIFSSSYQACLFFTGNLLNIGYAYKSIKNHYRWQGYYWEYLTKNNHPAIELSDNEFLNYQQKKLFTKDKQMRERISKSNRKVERCSREELKQLIREKPFTIIGNMFGVSDNAIRKWCDYYNLPRRVKDIKNYSDEEWNKL